MEQVITFHSNGDTTAEKNANAWFEEHPNVVIIDRKITAVGDRLWIVIFYRRKA